MTKTVDLTEDFDSAGDANDYVGSLVAKGIPFEAVDENTIIVFDDEEERGKWLELMFEPRESPEEAAP